MAKWEQLVACALLGTDQQQTPPLADESPLGSLISKLEAAGKSKEAFLLSAAGAVSLHTRAGYVPKSTSTRPTPPEGDDVPEVGTKFGKARYMALIDEYYDTLLPIWLQAVTRANKRVPEFLIPHLLAAGAKRRELQDLLPEAIGHRGRWLAGQNPEWAYAAGSLIEADSMEQLREAFETGLPEERRQAIQRLRESDAKTARDLVESTWKEDTHDQRAAFLQCFQINLSLDDELLLETAAADKKKEVRTVAQTLLAQLPQSRYHQRMVARIKPRMRLAGKELDVNIPTEIDKEMIQDGLTKFTQPEAYQRMQWITEMLRVVSPKVWEEEFKLPPAKITTELKLPHYVLDGFRQAAALHRNEEWIEAVSIADLASNGLDLMLSSVAPETKERIILRLVEKNFNSFWVIGNQYQQPILSALISARHDWSEEFGRKLIMAIRKEARNGGAYHTTTFFELAGLYFPASASKEVIEDLDVEFGGPANFPDHIAKFIGRLKFKSELYGDIK
jgi:hypothetical protein